MKKELLLSIASTVAVALVPVMAFAALPPDPNNGGAPDVGLSSLTGVGTFTCTVIGWMFYFLIILTILFVMVAAFGYLTAAGDPDKVKTASNRIIYAAVAVVVALLAKGIPFIVGSFLGASAFQGC